MTIYLVKSIAKAYGSLLNKYAPNLQRESPLQMHEPVYGDEDASFTDFVAPGIIITIAFSNSIGMTAITFVLDKKTGNMDRIWSCGAWASEIMLAQVITQLLIFVVQIGLLLLFGLVVFKLPLEGSPAEQVNSSKLVWLSSCSFHSSDRCCSLVAVAVFVCVVLLCFCSWFVLFLA